MNAKVGLLAVVMGLAWASVVTGADTKKPEEPPFDQLAAATASNRRGDYAAAVDHLGRFLGASAADPRQAEARGALVKIADTWPGGLVKQGQPAAAAAALLRCAAAAGPGDAAAERWRTSARQLVRDAYLSALQRNDSVLAYRLAVWAAKVWPDPPRVADDEAVRSLSVSALASQAGKARPEFLYQRARALLAAGGVTSADLEKAKVDLDELSLSYANELIERGWYAQAAAVAREHAAHAKALGPSRQAKWDAALFHADLWGAEAALALANPGIARKAVEAAEADLGQSPHAGDAAHLRALLNALRKPGDPKPLSASQALRGDGTWADTGAGYTCDQPVDIGKNGEGGYSAQILVRGPFVLDGGTLHVANGLLNLAGTPDRPVILRNVEIQVELNGTLRAANTLFVNCSFRKTGGWFSVGGYSAKWEFGDCLFSACKFAGLSKVDWGLHIQNCVFLRTDLPQRDGNDPSTRDGWDQVADCDVYNATVAPSVAWVAQRGNYYGCRVGPAATFDGKKDLDVTLGVPAEEDEVMVDFVTATSSIGPGRLAIARAPRPFSRARPLALWKWVDAAPLDGGAPGSTH